MICLKNIGVYSIAGLAYFLVGYNLMYVDVGDHIGTFEFFYSTSADEISLLDGNEAALAAVVDNGYAVMSDWFFQMVFVATAASIVSGAIAERIKMWPFLLFTLILTAVVYPVVGAWTWDGSVKPTPHPTSWSRPWGSSSFGSVGSPSTAGRSWRWEAQLTRWR